MINKTLNELNELVGETFTLVKLNSACKSITDGEVDMFNYDLYRDILSREEGRGSCAYNVSEDGQIGEYNIVFEILRDENKQKFDIDILDTEKYDYWDIVELEKQGVVNPLEIVVRVVKVDEI